jgi:hypothetical protein
MWLHALIGIGQADRESFSREVVQMAQTPMISISNGMGRTEARQGSCGDRIRPLAPALNTVIIILLIVLFNFYPDRVGFYRRASDLRTFVPLLAAEFQAHMPWLNAFWGASLALNAAKLLSGRWSQWLRWANLGLICFGVVVACRLLLGDPILGLNPAWVAQQQDFEALRRIQEYVVPLLLFAARMTLAVLIFVGVMTAWQRFSRLRR